MQWKKNVFLYTTCFSICCQKRRNKILKLIDPLISVYFNFMISRVNVRIDTTLPYVGIAEIYDVYHRYIMEAR